MIVTAIDSSRLEGFHSLRDRFDSVRSLFFSASFLHVPPVNTAPALGVGKVQIAFALGFELWR